MGKIKCKRREERGWKREGGHTVRKMDLILRPIERMLKMQFSMACKFTLQPLRINNVKPPE
jgi:hypothetical protein